MRIPALPSLLAILLISGCAIAQPSKPDADHSGHHPPAAAPGVAAAPSSPAGAPSPQAHERQMKAMQEMHLKMQAAKTPAERSALMDEHMKLMQSGMSMMGAMRGMGAMGSPGGPSPQSGMGMMPSPGAPAGPAAAPGASGPGMQGMAGMMNIHAHMERRMAMMEQMMQMLVDLEAAMPRK